MTTPHEVDPIEVIIEDTIDAILLTYWSDSFNGERLEARLTSLLRQELQTAKQWPACREVAKAAITVP